ncbi:MAG: heterodisulfide reductase-related iron-sulfur binding cluster [Firmicutes bacterium]|nr:heterodisulfide reductase-related iron-sulfur binding cluster [Bacillota bacterium]
MSPLSITAFFILLIGALYGFASGVYERYRFLRLGQPEFRTDRPRERWASFFRNVLGQGKVLAEPSGIGHFFIFWGFLILGLGELDFFSFGLFGVHIPGFTAYWFTFVQELFAAFVMIAVVVAALRRYVWRPMRIEATLEAGFILLLIFAIVVTLFLVGGLDAVQVGTLPGGAAPMSNLVAQWFAGTPPQVAGVWSQVFFWVHVLAIFGFLVFIPRSKHLHMIAAVFNAYFRKLEPTGKIKKLDLTDESVEEFGVSKITQFTWKQLLDGYACTECGRCHVSCPATLTGKDLSPKYLILKMKDHLIETGPSLLKLAAGAETMEEAMPALIGEVYTEDEVWACTTCRACEEACPVFNEHVSLIVDMRRNLVLTEGKASGEVNRAFTNLERHSNEWGRPRSARAEWTEGLDVPILSEMDDPSQIEYLYYVGSAASFDARNQKIAQSFARLLNQAGVKFAILGKEEESDGDSARRLGNEFLYQELVEKNVEIFKEYGIRKIVTTDPHAFNTFRKEYPDFGFEAEIIHHTELLARLIDEGRLRPEHRVERRITYHDSCYLGRYNEVYTAPRYILSKIPGLELVEMERSRNKSMCCGAGGGSMFKEETGDMRINVLRTEQALATGATAIATACPYCMTMLIDGTKAKGVEDDVATFDVVELLAMAVAG